MPRRVPSCCRSSSKPYRKAHRDVEELEGHLTHTLVSLCSLSLAEGPGSPWFSSFKYSNSQCQSHLSVILSKDTPPHPDTDQVLTKMAKSLGALEIVLLGDKALGTCSKVTAVGRMRAERRTTAKPWGPWKAQQLPGCTSG